MARPCNKDLGAQTKRWLGTVTSWPGLDPSVVGIRTISVASSVPPGGEMMMLVKGLLREVVVHVLLLHPGLAGGGHVLHNLELARVH